MLKSLATRLRSLFHQPRTCANCGEPLPRHPHGGQWCSSLCEFDQS